MDKQTVLPSIIFITAVVIYYNSLDCGFVFDDISAIKDNKDLRSETPIQNLFWNDFWGTPMHKEKSHKSYRPLCVLTFRWNYALGGLDPWGYHLANTVLHAAVCLILHRVVQMFVAPQTAFVATMLFTVHPIHTEAVTGVVGRAELLSSIFYLCALLMYAQSTGRHSKTKWPNLLITVAMVATAMLCKEQGITVIAVCCVYEVFIVQRLTVPDLIRYIRSILSGKPQLPSWLWEAAFRAGVLVGSTVLLMVARVKVMGAQLPVFTKFDNPAAVAPTPSRQLTLNYLLSVNAWLLLFPSELCCDWTMGTIPLIEGLFDVRNLATLVFYILLGKLLLFSLGQRGQLARAVLMALSLMIFPFLPASNLFFPVGFVVAERILYAPSMGFCILVALGFEQTLKKAKQYLKPVLWFLMGILLLTHSTKTVMRNYDWVDEYTIFKAALKVNQQNAKLFNNVGHALENEKRYSEALKYFQKAASVQPDDIGAHINVGRTYNNLEQFSEAEVAFQTAMDLLPPVKPGQSYTTRIAPNHLNVFINLGNLISRNESRLLEADALYRTCISMRPDYVQAYINRGDILMKLNRTKEAQQQYEIALRYEEDNADLHYNLGVVLLEQNHHAEAFQSFEKALKYNPNHKQTLFNSAVLMQEMGLPKYRPEAYRRLHMLEEEDKSNEKIYFNLGMLAMDDRKYEDAKHWFDMAIQLKDDFRSALFNIALLLCNDLQRPLEAVPYLKKLLKYYPDHTKGLVLMGDININHYKDLDAAEQNFLTILKLDPKHIQANHNLCVVYVERGDLYRAERCLADTLKLAPHEDYIQQHLNIVRGRIHKAQQQAKMQAQHQQSHQQPKQQQP